MADKRKTHWEDEEIEKLVTLWLSGYSLDYIGKALPDRGKMSCKDKIWRIVQENPELYELKKKMREERQEKKEKKEKAKAKQPNPREKRAVQKTDRPAIYHGQKHSMC